jgi:hypothetical protein
MKNCLLVESVIMQRPAPVHRASLLPIVLLSAAGFTVMTTEFIIVGLLPSGLASVRLAGAVIVVAAMAATLSLVTAPQRLPRPS